MSERHDDSAEKELNAILDVLERWEKDHRSRYGGTLAARLDGLFREYEGAAVKSLDATKHFRDDVLITLRAIALIADSVSSGNTHAEKNARLRGLIEMIESSAEKLRKFSFDVTSADWQYGWDSVFKSDFPTRTYLRRIQELEHELAQYRKPKEGEVAPDDIPF